MKARSKKTPEPNQALLTSVTIAVAITIFMSGCATQRAKFNQEFSRQTELHQQQVQQPVLYDEQQVKRDNDALSAQVSPVPKIEMVPLEMDKPPTRKTPSPNNDPTLPTGVGIPTGRTKMAMDGTTYYEMKDINGSTYWTNVKR